MTEICACCRLERVTDRHRLCSECTGDPEVRARHPIPSDPKPRRGRPSKHPQKLTQPEMVLLAMYALDLAGLPCTIHAIAERAWNRWPRIFGWGDGKWAEHPDAQIVRISLAHHHGSLRRWIRKRDKLLWELTEAGRMHAERLLWADPTARNRKAGA